MKKLLFTVFLISEAFFISGQTAGNILYNSSNRWAEPAHMVQQKAVLSNMNEFTLDINCMFNTVADSYLAIFHVTQLGANAREADSLMNKRINDFKSSLKEIDIKDESVVIDMLSMVPLFEVEVIKKAFSKTYNEIPAGFEIQKNIHIHFTDEQQLDGIITGAAINEIYDLVKVDYYVKNTAEIYEAMREEAIKLVKKRMSELDSLGIKTEGQWRMVADQIGVFFPMDRYQSYQAFSYTSVESMNKKANITQMKKPTTLYYNKIPYTNYDIIFNPEIIEPAVQYTYNMTMRFQLERPVKEPAKKEVVQEKTKYVMITENGDFKELQLAK